MSLVKHVMIIIVIILKLRLTLLVILPARASPRDTFTDWRERPSVILQLDGKLNEILVTVSELIKYKNLYNLHKVLKWETYSVLE